MILELERQGLGVSAIARQTGLDRKTVRNYLERGLEAPVYGPREPEERLAEDYHNYLVDRLAACPGLSARRLHREIKANGFEGAHSTLTEYLRLIRPATPRQFERRFETPAGQQAQVDSAEFQVEFTSEPDITRKVWLFSMVLGHNRWLLGRFCPNQTLETVMRCHIAAFDAMGEACTEVLCYRIKTAVIGEDAAGIDTYNASLVALLAHYGSACARSGSLLSRSSRVSTSHSSHPRIVTASWHSPTHEKSKGVTLLAKSHEGWPTWSE